METKFICKNKTEYYVDTTNNTISKINHKGEKQLLTYNDMSKMYLDFSGLKLTPEQTDSIKQYLISHPFTTFLFGGFPKTKIQPKATVEEFVEKISASGSKLFAAYAGSILFLQSEGKSYEDILAGNVSTVQMKSRISGFNAFYFKYNKKTYDHFPAIAYDDFLQENQAIYRNSACVEQLLKMLNISIDSKLYHEIKPWLKYYMQGKVSQRPAKEVWYILNLTTPYSVYGLSFLDKDFEKKIQEHVQIIRNKHPLSSPDDRPYILTKYDLYSTEQGKQLFDKIFRLKVENNSAFANKPQIVDYLFNTLNIQNYLENPEDEKDKMVTWLMEQEHSTNRDGYASFVYPMLEHNVDYVFENLTKLTNDYGSELQNKENYGQEFHKLLSCEITASKQTPKIFQQIKDLISDESVLPLYKKIITMQFFHTLNKKAVEEFINEGKPLPDSFSRFFSVYLRYVLNNSSSINDVCETMVEVIAKREKLPAWILRECVSNERSGGDSFGNLKDSLLQLSEIDEAISMTKEQIYDKLYRTNCDENTISFYVNQILEMRIPPNKLKFEEDTNYDFYKFFKSLKLDMSSPNLKAELEQQVGKYIYDISNVEWTYKKLQELKTIKRIKPNELSIYTRDIQNYSLNLREYLKDKEAESKTIRTYLTRWNDGLTGEELEKFVSEDHTPITHDRQVIYKDKHFCTFIPTFKDIQKWAVAMNNCMERCYLGPFKRGDGVFLFICEVDESGNPLFDKAWNATYVEPENFRRSYYYDDNSNYPSAKQMSKTSKYNESTKNKKSPNYKKPELPLLNGFKCVQCYSNGCVVSRWEGQPLIYELKTRSGAVIQTKEHRYNLWLHWHKIIDLLGFDPAYWGEDFDKAMEPELAERQSNIKK